MNRVPSELVAIPADYLVFPGRHPDDVLLEAGQGAEGLHTLTMKTYTPGQWAAQGAAV
jgi:hypothetical protein